MMQISASLCSVFPGNFSPFLFICFALMLSFEIRLVGEKCMINDRFILDNQVVQKQSKELPLEAWSSKGENPDSRV